MKCLLILASLALSLSAHASPARCLLQVDGVKYIDGDCNYDDFKDGNGSFSIGTDDPKNVYFAYVIIEDDKTIHASWNGTEIASHAHEDLGTMKRNGACVENAHAKVCAWAK